MTDQGRRPDGNADGERGLFDGREEWIELRYRWLERVEARDAVDGRLGTQKWTIPSSS